MKDLINALLNLYYLINPKVKHVFILTIIHFTAQAQNSNYTVSSVAGTAICLSRDQFQYILKVKVNIPAGACTITKYTIFWDDGEKESFPFDPNKLEHEHPYDFKDFVNGCEEVIEKDVKIETDNTNCRSNITPVYFYNSPRPDFATDREKPCVGQDVRFIPNACPRTDNTTYIWDYGVPGIVNDKGMYKYTKAGIYNVKLSVSSMCGSEKKTITVPRDIEIIDRAKAVVKDSGYVKSVADTSIICFKSGGVVRLNGSDSEYENSYEWSFNNNSAIVFLENTNRNSEKPKIKFTKPGIYTISLTVNNDCEIRHTVNRVYKVEDVPLPKLADHDDRCTPIDYKVSDYSTNVAGTIYKLNGDIIGFNEVKHLGFSISPYVVEASINNVCGSNPVRKSFSITPPEEVRITSFRDTLVCLGTNSLILTTNIAGGKWSGDTTETQGSNSIFIPKQTGTFEIKYVKGIKECMKRDSVKVVVKGVDITANDISICQGENKIALKATPTGGLWTTTACTTCIKNDTIDISNVSLNQIKVNYSVAGSIGNGKSCNASKEVKISVGNPKAIFTIDSSICIGQKPIIKNESKNGSTYQWFVNGDFKSGAFEPQLTIAAGNSVFKLVVSAGACKDSLEKLLKVKTPPDPLDFDLVYKNDCSPVDVAFNVKPSSRNDVVYFWNFGDDTKFEGFQPPDKSYINKGTDVKKFTISVNASSGCGVPLEKKIDLSVQPQPIANIGADSTIARCSPATILFTNRSTGTDGIAVWDFGDGKPQKTTLRGQNTIPYEFVVNGDTDKTFYVKITVKNSCDTSTDSIKIVVSPKSISAYTTIDPNSGACVGNIVTFRDASTPKPNQVTWKFMDGNKIMDSTAGSVVTYKFPKPNKVYDVIMTATTLCRSYDIRKTQIKTFPETKPKISISNNSICAGESVKIQNLLNVTDVKTFHWNFGDGTNEDSTNFNTSHTFETAGTSKISLLIQDPNGCLSSIDTSITVRKKPKAQMLNDSILICSANSFVLRSSNADISSWTWTWYIDEMSYSNNSPNSPAITLSKKEGVFDVFLVVNDGVCKDSTVFPSAVNLIDCNVHFPDAFSPDNTKGKYWTIFGKGIKTVELKIFNRWGEEIYSSNEPIQNDQDKGWDGSFKGQPMPTGVYPYQARIILIDDREYSRKGFIKLIRGT